MPTEVVLALQEQSNMKEILQQKIDEITKQIVYWREQVFVTHPNDMEQLNTTITSLEYVLYNYQKMLKKYEQNPPRN